MARKGLLLINLGSPASTDPNDVKVYLNQFLTDKYVIDIPSFFRHILVRGWIAPRRAKNSAEAYESIWTDQGSPLVNYTRSFAQKVQLWLGPQIEVRWAMRYGEPSLPKTLNAWNVDEMIVVPLYPQYAESSTRTAIEEATPHLSKSTKVRVIKDFFEQKNFVASEVIQIQRHLDKIKPDHLLLSYHGLPEHHLQKMYPNQCLKDSACCAEVNEKNRYCYRAQCFATTRAISAQLKYPRNQISVSFQSRLGRRPWIKPYTDYVVPALVKQGVRRLAVACPSFVSDCLETLEEIQMRLREQFISEGGSELFLIPALNDEEFWVENFCKMITEMDPPN